MGNYGLRISKKTKDARDCIDLDTLLTSKYPFFKGSAIITGSVILVNAETKVVTIAHNLGYRPFYQARCNNFGASGGGMFMNIPGTSWSVGSGGLGISVDCTADENNIYLLFTQTNSDFGPLAGIKNYNYVVFIYKDKAQI